MKFSVWFFLRGLSECRSYCSNLPSDTISWPKASVQPTSLILVLNTIRSFARVRTFMSPVMKSVLLESENFQIYIWLLFSCIIISGYLENFLAGMVRLAWDLSSSALATRSERFSVVLVTSVFQYKASRAENIYNKKPNQVQDLSTWVSRHVRLKLTKTPSAKFSKTISVSRLYFDSRFSARFSTGLVQRWSFALTRLLSHILCLFVCFWTFTYVCWRLPRIK